MKALIIAPPWIGDMVMTQPLLRVLKERHNNIIIDVLALVTLHPLIQRMPEVNQCISSPFKHKDIKIWQRWQFGKQLRTENYTHAYLIPNSIKSALIPFFANIPQRVGWLGEQRYGLLNDIRILDKKKYLRAVERFTALGFAKSAALPQELPLPQLKINNDQLAKVKTKINIPSLKNPILALCPGPEHRPAKRWPPHYFAEIARAQKKAGWDIWLFGGPKEQPLAETVQQQSGNICLNLVGKTNLGEVVDLLSLADVVVANDSGLMHVASALNKKIIAIYGPTPPEHAPPLTVNKFKTLSLNLDCSPCPATVCHLGHNNCMLNLKPEMVMQAIENLT